MNGGLEISSSPDNDDDDADDIDQLLTLSDVDASLHSLSLKHHLAMKSVCFVISRAVLFEFLWF